MTVGPWMDDANPTEVPTATRWSSPQATPRQTYGWIASDNTPATPSTPQAKADEAWELAEVDYSGEGMPESSITAAGNAATWVVSWLTVAKPTSPVVVASSTLPFDPFTDPTVVDVEWEPTSAVVSQRLQLRAFDISIPTAMAGKNFAVKLVDGVGTRYEPAPESAATLNARTTIALVPSAGGSVASVDLTSPPLSVGIGSSFAFTLVDPWTSSGSVADLPAGGLSHKLRADLWWSFRPRYRLVYSDVPAVGSSTRATPSLRMLQRGGAGGIGGIPRAVGNPTRQASPRRGSGTVL